MTGLISVVDVGGIFGNEIPDFRIYDEGIVGTLELGREMQIVEGVSGMHYFAHKCIRPERGTIYCAPRLSNHTRTGPLLTITIRASIGCGDCAIHGWVTDGVWRSV